MPKRTDQQRKAIEVYASMLADALNSAGYDMKIVLSEKELPVSWSQHSVKECLFRPIAHALFGYDSTASLKVEEVTRVYDVLNRWTSERFGVGVPWPSQGGSTDGRPVD